MKQITICSVCGYDKLDYPIQNYDICPSCFCEFGVSDLDWTYSELREDWITRGAQWANGSNVIPTPPNWSACRQLLNVGYRVTPSDLIFMNITDLNADELAREKERLLRDKKIYVGEHRDNYKVQDSGATIGTVFVKSSHLITGFPNELNAQICVAL